MKKELIVEYDPKNPVSEIFRTLRTNIQFMNSKRNLKTILVTSTMPGEGKTWISSNLAISFAQNGKKVILIDGDMRKGRNYSLFGVKPRPGLSNFLSGIDESEASLNIRNYIQHSEIQNLDCLVAGNVPPNPSELINSDEMYNLLEDLKDMYDLIVIDGTPSNLVADSIILSRIVDKTIIVASYAYTKKEYLNYTIQQIRNVGGSIAGVVFNRVPESVKGYKKNGYGHYYYGPKERVISRSKPLKQITKDKMVEDLQKSRLKIARQEMESGSNLIHDNNYKVEFTPPKIKNAVSPKKESNISNVSSNSSKQNTNTNTNTNTNNNQNKKKKQVNNNRNKNDNNKNHSRNANTTQILQEIDQYLKEEKKKIK